MFLPGDFMSYVDQFGDYMSGDFLTWIRIIQIMVVNWLKIRDGHESKIDSRAHAIEEHGAIYTVYYWFLA